MLGLDASCRTAAQPKMHSISARHDCDMPSPSRPVVRPSMTLRHAVAQAAFRLQKAAVGYHDDAKPILHVNKARSPQLPSPAPLTSVSPSPNQTKDQQ